MLRTRAPTNALSVLVLELRTRAPQMPCKHRDNALSYIVSRLLCILHYILCCWGNTAVLGSRFWTLEQAFLHNESARHFSCIGLGLGRGPHVLYGLRMFLLRAIGFVTTPCRATLPEYA